MQKLNDDHKSTSRAVLGARPQHRSMHADAAEAGLGAPPQPPNMHAANAGLGASTTSALSAQQDASEQHLVVDVLNFLIYFVPVKDKRFENASAWTLLREMKLRVAKFMNACSHARITPHFVIDCGFASAECGTKWRKRREREIKEQYKAMPYYIDTALGAAFRAHGGDVIQAPNLDADDVVIATALHYGGGVLSQDRDMLRYTDVNWDSTRLYESFRLNRHGRLELHPRSDMRNTARQRQARAIRLELEHWKMPQMKMVSAVISNGVLLRGNSDSFTQSMGNVHMLARPLRQALYARLGVVSVREEIPYWDAEQNRVVWSADDVAPDAALDALLDDPPAAYAWLAQADAAHGPAEAVQKRYAVRQNRRQWRSYSRAIIVAEYCLNARQLAGAHVDVETLTALAQSIDPLFVPELDLRAALARQRVSNRHMRLP